MLCAPGGRLRLALATRSLSRISGELEIMVMLVPARMQQAMGSSRRFSGIPVRELRRLTTGMNSAARAWLCMIADMLPTIALIRCETRVSTPPASLRMKFAALPSMPVRSRPAPMIITAINDITALPANPSNN